MKTPQSNSDVMRILLIMVVAALALMAIGFLYWASTGDPVQAPQAPTPGNIPGT